MTQFDVVKIHPVCSSSDNFCAECFSSSAVLELLFPIIPSFYVKQRIINLWQRLMLAMIIISRRGQFTRVELRTSSHTCWWKRMLLLYRSTEKGPLERREIVHEPYQDGQLIYIILYSTHLLQNGEEQEEVQVALEVEEEGQWIINDRLAMRGIIHQSMTWMGRQAGTVVHMCDEEDVGRWVVVDGRKVRGLLHCC